MPDPNNPQINLNPGDQTQVDPGIESLFSSTQQIQPDSQSEIDSLFSQEDPGITQAQHLINLRDQPAAIDFILGTAERFKKGQLPFNQQSWQDVQGNVDAWQRERMQEFATARENNDWLKMTGMALTGIGKIFGAYLQAGFGATNKDLEAAQQSLGAKNYIGDLTDPKEASKALRLAQVYTDDLDSGISIAPKGQKPAMAFGTGPLTAKVGMNLAMAEEYLQDLQSDKNKALGTAGLRNFAIQSGDAFLPFISIGDIVVDEKDPDQIARRAVLTNKINEVINRDYGISTVSGAAIGSVGSFITAGSAATKLLGKTEQLASGLVKTPSLLSRGATYSVIGASQSFEGDPRNLSLGQRLASITSESMILGIAEGAGNKLEDSIDHAVAAHQAVKALSQKVPEMGAVLGGMGKIVGTTVGETSSEEIEAILRGQDPLDPFLQNLGVSFGIGVGMGLPGMTRGAIAARKMKINQLAIDKFTNALKATVDQINSDTNLSPEQKQLLFGQLREIYNTPSALNLINAIIAGSTIDKTTSPNSAKVTDEAIDSNKQKALESLLDKKVKESQKPSEILKTITGPVDENQAEEAFAELVGMFEQGLNDIRIENTPANEVKIKWLQSQGRIEGEFSPDNTQFIVKNVKNAAGEWLRGVPAIEFEQDLKDQIMLRAEELDLPEADRNALNDELEAAGTIEDINEAAAKYLGPDDYDLAVEKLNLVKHEKVEEERQTQLKIKAYNDRIEFLNKQLKEALPEDRAQLEQLIQQLTQQRDAEVGIRQQRGEQSMDNLVKQYEDESDMDQKSGKLAPELEQRPEVVLPINNPSSNRYQKFSQLTEPDPRENDVNALGNVFNLKREETVALLQSLGALDENLRPLMTPAEVAVEFMKRKMSYLTGKALSGYQGFNIADQVSSAFIREFQLQIRSGVPIISLSTLFNSRLRDFIRLARPRMRAGVGLGMALDFDRPGIRPNRVAKDQFADESGLDGETSNLVDDALDDVESMALDMPGMAGVSPAQRQEALGIIAQEIIPVFRNSLKSEVERSAFDMVFSGKKDIEARAKALGISSQELSAISDASRENLKQQILARFRQLASENNLPSAEVKLPEGVKIANAVPIPVIQRINNRLRSMIANSLISDDTEDMDRKVADVLINNLRSEQSKDALNAIESYLDNIETQRLSQQALQEDFRNINDFLKGSQEEGSISQEELDAILQRLNALADKYYETLGEQFDETSPEYKKLTLDFKANLFSVFDEAEALRNKNLNQRKGTDDETKLKGAPGKPKTTVGKVETDKEKAPGPKRVSDKTVPPTGTKMDGGPKRTTTVSGGPGAERNRGEPIPKTFVEAPAQRGKIYPLNSVNTLGNKIVSRMTEEQKQDAEAAIVAMESSKNNAFYLANGPGTGKTLVLLATAKYYLDRGFNVVYLTASDAVTPNWDEGTIGGSLQKEADLNGIPLAVRGAKGNNNRGLPIEKVPGKVLVSTYRTEHLDEILKLTDSKTVVLFDEHHNGRSLFQKEQEGKYTAWSVIMNEIAKKAGRVMMASGTPFETPDQLFSLGRLGIFDTESPEALFGRLGFQKEYLKGGKKSKKSYWRLADGVTYQEMQDRLEEYINVLVKGGVMRSRSLKLDGVNVQFKDVPLDDNIVKILEDIKARYGGEQNTSIGALRAMVAAQKRALEEYKVEAAARQAIDAIRRKKKPIVYVGYVSDEDSNNNKVDPTSKAVEEAILRLAPDLKIARMYTGAEETKEQAMVAFNEGSADVLIATKEKGGTGIELDDKFGDEAREMIVMSPPVSAIQAVQLIYRVWRTDSASTPSIVFLESKAEVDQFNLDRMRSKLRLLEATVGSGFEKLQDEDNVNPNTKVEGDQKEPAAEQITFVESGLNKIFGNAYKDGKLVLKDAKGQERVYPIKITLDTDHVVAAFVGENNDTDTIIINPERLANALEILGQNAFEKWLPKVMLEEMIHVETYRHFRDQGLDPVEEITAIGKAMSEGVRRKIARIYYSNSGQDISNEAVKEQIQSLTNDYFLVAMEGIRIISQLDLTKGISEQLVVTQYQDIKRVNERIKDLIDSDASSNLMSRLALWFEGMIKVIQDKLGLLPSAKDRLDVRTSIEDAVAGLKSKVKTFRQESQGRVVSAARPEGTSPTSPRPSNKLDTYDLRIYKAIENVLEGKTPDVMGVEVDDDMFKTVSTEDWLNALDTNFKKGLITKQERDLFRAATKFYNEGGRVSLPGLANKAMEIAEEMETAGQSLPAEAFTNISTGTDIKPGSVSEYGTYRVKIGGYEAAPTSAKSAAQAVGNYVSRFLDYYGTMSFNNRTYTKNEKKYLMAAIRDTGYDRFAKRLTPTPLPAAAAPIPTFEQFATEKSNLPVPEKPVVETFRDDFGEINVTKAWEQVKETRPSVVKVPRGYLESYLPYIKTKKEMVEKANPNQPGLAEFIRNPERPEYVGIRVVDGWHRAQKALNENVDFYVYPVMSEKSSMQNAYDFAVNFDGFYPRTAPAAAAAAEPIRSTTELLNKEKKGQLAYHGTQLVEIPSLLSGIYSGTNFSGDFKGQSFGAGEVILVYPKDQLSLEKKTYQDDLVLKESSFIRPVAALIDLANFEGIEGRRSIEQVGTDLETLTEEEQKIVGELSAVISIRNRKAEREIIDRLRGNPAAIQKQLEDMRIREFKGKYYLPNGQEISKSSLPKAEEPNPNADKIIKLAREIGEATETEIPGTTQEQEIKEALKLIPANIPVWSFELDPETATVTNLREQRAAPAPAASAEPIRPTAETGGRLPFYAQIAKSIYDYARKTNRPMDKTPEGGLTFSSIATDKQAKYTKGRSGQFIDDSGKLVVFSPFGGNSILFYIPSETAPAPAAAAEPQMRVSKAASNIITQFVDVIPDGPIKDKLLDYWYYQSTPREEQFAMARDYIARNGGHEAVVDHFLSGNIKTTLPLQAAIGFELARYLGDKAKTNLLAKEQLAEVMIKLSRKYGTEPGQAVDLWNALENISDNPEVMKMFVGRQVDDAIKGRLSGYAEEESEIKGGLNDANRRAADKMAVSPKNQKILSTLGNLIELNKKKVSVTEFESALNDFFNSEDAKKDAIEFLGEDLAGTPEVEGSDSDEIRLNPNQTKALGRLIVKILQTTDNPRALASSPDLVKEALFNVAGIKDSPNPENVRRKIDLYFDASLDYAIRSFSAEAIRAARIRENKELPESETPGEIQPVQTKGEARRQKNNTVQKMKEESPVPVFIQGDGTVSDEAIALADAVEDSLMTAAEKSRAEPKIKTVIEKFIADTKRMVRNRIKEKGGLPDLYEKPKPPTAAEVLRDRIANNKILDEAITMARDSMKNVYSEEELSGLEVFIDEALGRTFTTSDLKRALRTLSSIGGADVNVRSLIRQSKGDLMTFEDKLSELLINNTNLNLAERKQVLDYLREGMSELIAQERKAELSRIKARFERAKERKTRKVRSALDKLIEATNLGVLNDSELFAQMHGQLGLPELKPKERARLNKLIEDLPLYPKGMIRNKKISEMYQYVKLVSPQVWGELIVNYQTSNLLAGIGTIGINAWSSYMSNLLNGSIMGMLGTTYGLLGNKAKAKGYIQAAKDFNSAFWAGRKPAFNAAQNVFFKGDYSSVQDALTMELGGVNIWEAILNQAEAYRAGKPGAVKPELPVKVFGEEYRIPLDSKYLSSKYGALAPFIWFGRAMAAGDAINKISSKKMYEIAEATNIAAAKFKTQQEIEAEVKRLLNLTPDAVRRAEAKAAAEAKEFNMTPQQQALRVEEILEQNRPDEEDVRNLMERTKEFAARSTFTNNFEGWFGLLADGLTSISAKAWPLRLFIKFLRTGSSLANEMLNFMPVISTVRMYRGSAGMLKQSKYYRPPPTPGTVEHDLLMGKMVLGYTLTAALLMALKDALGGEDDPYFNIHFKGPLDPSQREAFFAAGGKLRSIQVGRWRDGKPQFFSFESFPVGMSAPLILAGAITESCRYEKRSGAEAAVMGTITGGALAMYGVLDMAALSGIRQIMSLTSPGVGEKDPKSIITNLTKTMGNVVGGLVPGYATFRDIEQLWNGVTGAPSARPYQQNLMSTFLQTIPFASKIGDPDLNFLGGNVKTQFANTVPFIRRLTTFGVDSRDYDNGDRGQQAVLDKLMSLFAANRTSLDWDAGPLKDFAMMELVAQAKQDGVNLTADDFFQLSRELTPEEKYEWLQRAGPILQQQLGSMIPQLEKLSRPQFIEIVRKISNPIKRQVLTQILMEKNQQGILYKQNQ